jgi:putative ABC transport system permease protein
VIRTSGNPMDLAGAVRAELGAVDPEIPAAGVRDMATILRESVSDRRLHAFVIAASGGLALALAAIGLYGVMAYTVAQRTSEMGLRIAMGASRGSVLSLVVREGLWLVLAGAAAGLVAALPMAGSLADMLFDVQPRDFGIYAGAVAVLLAVGALASAIPARRATRVDPLTALRSE